MECLEGSGLPEELRDMGYDVVEIGHGQRIQPGAIVERFAVRSDGTLEPITSGSTARRWCGLLRVSQNTRRTPPQLTSGDPDP
jgi:hypothetical protein